MTAVLEANGLGKRYGHKWALSECTLAIPTGKVVGPHRMSSRMRAVTSREPQRRQSERVVVADLADRT